MSIDARIADLKDRERDDLAHEWLFHYSLERRFRQLTRREMADELKWWRIARSRQKWREKRAQEICGG